MFTVGAPPALSASIVIPVSGGREQFLRCLASLLQQSFFKTHPAQVQLVIVQDGEEDESTAPICNASRDLLFQFQQAHAICDVLVLKENSGRAAARNMGLTISRGDVIFFLDSDIVLHPDFIMEHMVRHEFLDNVALLGFKQNIDWQGNPQFSMDSLLNDQIPQADCREDWKYGSGGAKYNYMEATDSFKAWPPTKKIEGRILPSVFQTNIVSVRRSRLFSVGGFDQQFCGWGMEDTDVGLKLFAHGCYLVPCPSSTAFHLKHPEPEGKEGERLANEELMESNSNAEYREKSRVLHDFAQRMLDSTTVRWIVNDSLKAMSSLGLEHGIPAPYFVREAIKKLQNRKETW